MNAGIFPPSQLFFDKGEQPKVTWSQVGTVRGVGGQNWDAQSPWLCGLCSTLGSFFFPGTSDDITFLITSNNHVANDVNKKKFMVIG